jgi:hypothetical protein
VVLPEAVALVVMVQAVTAPLMGVAALLWPGQNKPPGRRNRQMMVEEVTMVIVEMMTATGPMLRRPDLVDVARGERVRTRR